jgi:hypothetical protein
VAWHVESTELAWYKKKGKVMNRCIGLAIAPMGVMEEDNPHSDKAASGHIGAIEDLSSGHARPSLR